MRLVIGLIGRIGSGKGTVSEFLHEKYGASEYRFSDVLKDVLFRLHLLNIRENLQLLGKTLRDGFGDGVLANTIKEDIMNDPSSIVVVDGIRYKNEVDMVRSFKDNILINVTAPPKIRYERCVSRGTRGEAENTFEEFVRNENKETESQIREIEKEADYTVDNSGTKDELYEKIEEIVRARAA